MDAGAQSLAQALVGLSSLVDLKLEMRRNPLGDDGIDAINTFYRENELAESLAVAGPACVAGNEAAIPLRAVVVQDGRRLELDVIDVAEIDDAGRVLSMRAFFDLEGAREL